MKIKLLLVLLAAPILVFSQGRKEKKEQEKADKELLTNLQEHIQYLTKYNMQDRTPGSDGEILASQYISNRFGLAGLEPEGGSGYLQDFYISTGKYIASSDNNLIVNNSLLVLGKDFFPLLYSPNMQTKGASSPGLREKGEPWFFDINEIVEDNKDDPKFNIHDVIRKEAETVAVKGGMALLVYNSGNVPDNITFTPEIPNDAVGTPVAVIPIVYITREGMNKYLPDETDIYGINVGVNIQNKYTKGHNVVGVINNNAPHTVLIAAHYDNIAPLKNQGDPVVNNSVGTSILLELARLLKATKSTDNNYLIMAFSGESGLYGSKYWIEHASPSTPINYMLNIDIGTYISNTLNISGYTSSKDWQQIISSVNQGNLKVIPADLSDISRSDFVNFYKNDIPVFCFAAKDEEMTTAMVPATTVVDMVKYIQQVISAANSKGKIQFSQDNLIK